MKMTIKFISMVLLLAAPYFSYGQYFQRLYDIDSSYDLSWDICAREDGNYFVLAWSRNPSTGNESVSNMVINSTGSQIQRHILHIDSTVITPGLPGELKKLQGGGYILPASLQRYYRATGITYSAAGLIKYTAAGDTVFLKTYTDTSVYFDLLSTCAVTSNGSYLLAGGRSHNTASSYNPAYLIHTDSNGSELWSHSYQKYTTQEANIDNVISLPDGNIVAAASSTYEEYISGWGNRKHNTPWFLLLDSMGNVIRDTVYGADFMVGTQGIVGELYPDKNGGYIHIGVYDSLFTADPTDQLNYPCYIAHLDTNFRITWITEFIYSHVDGRRQPVLLRQLRDSSYLVLGDAQAYNGVTNIAFAAKVSRRGELLWTKNFRSDSNNSHFAYFRDMAQCSDGSLVFTGITINDSLPAWHTTQDVWLVGTDSNGCEIVNCGNPIDTITGIKNVAASGPLSVSVFPNPTYGNFTVSASSGGTFTLYTLLGQQLQAYRIEAGQTELKLPATLAAGTYLGKFKPDAGGPVKEVRLVFQP